MASGYTDAISRLQVILKESDGEEEEEIILGSDYLMDLETYSDRDTDTEDYYLEEETQAVKNSGVYVGTDKTTVWMKQKLKLDTGDDAAISDLDLPGPRGEAARVTDPLGSWKILFDDAIIGRIVESTNANIEKGTLKFARERDCRKTDSREIYALIGLLYLGGLFKSSHVFVKDLWSSDGTGMSIFHTTMSYKRFSLLLRYLSFDDSNTREEREKVDNLAQIRELFDMFVARCQESYSISRYFTIDNILVPFRGKCIFRQYVPAKQVRNGIKMFPLVDSSTLYTWNMEIYDSKQQEGPFKVSNSPDDIVKRLTAPLFKSGRRTLTTDKWFTSFPLARDLLAQDITLVGVMKQNKPEVPSQFKSSVNVRRDPHSSLFGFRDDATLVSHCSGEGKCTVLLSTMHRDAAVDRHDGERTPEILKFFDSTKGAVCRVEEMAACYSTSRITSRWPAVVFFWLLNIAALNARIILMSTGDPPLKYKSRREYLKDLGLALVSDHIKYRSSWEHLPRHLKMQCAEVTGECSSDYVSGQPPLKKNKVAKKGRCTMCPRSKDKKTKTVCFYCMKLVCPDHYRPVCQTCAEGDIVVP